MADLRSVTSENHGVCHVTSRTLKDKLHMPMYVSQAERVCGKETHPGSCWPMLGRNESQGTLPSSRQRSPEHPLQNNRDPSVGGNSGYLSVWESHTLKLRLAEPSSCPQATSPTRPQDGIAVGETETVMGRFPLIQPQQQTLNLCSQGFMRGIVQADAS